MVGFVKELVDECGMEDITNPEILAEADLQHHAFTGYASGSATSL